MRGSRATALLIAIFTCFGCGNPPGDKIAGIDWEVWKTDRNGCQMKREGYADTLAAQTDRLKALSEMEIVKLMGRPDRTELLERNQKFFTYFLNGGPGCADTRNGTLWLAIRFNAMGLAKEVMLQGEVP